MTNGDLKMLKILNSELDLVRLVPGDEEIVICFVPTNRDIYRMLQACHNLKALYVHPDIFKLMPCVGQTLLYMQKVELVVEGNIPNHPPRLGDEPCQNEDEAQPRPRAAGVVLLSG
jgi:hypothetical protein